MNDSPPVFKKRKKKEKERKTLLALIYSTFFFIESLERQIMHTHSCEKNFDMKHNIKTHYSLTATAARRSLSLNHPLRLIPGLAIKRVTWHIHKMNTVP